MRPLLATMSNVDALLPGVLLGACLNLCASEVAVSEPIEPAALEAGTPAAPACDSDSMIADHQSALVEMPCAADVKISEEKVSEEATEARVYLVETAKPGGTMTRQGPELAIGRLHPEFAVRLASALREARSAGLPSAGIFSAYRPPAFGVGGFRDKFHSLHTYGLAVDMHGIGRPGSPEAQRWHEIAAKHGVVCPYGSSNRAEWNHCQPTRLKMVSVENPLRETVSAHGPLDLVTMFEAGNAVIESQASASDTAAAGMPVRMASLQVGPVVKLSESRRRTTAHGNANRASRKAGHSKMARRAGEKPGIRTAAGRSPAVKIARRSGDKPGVRTAGRSLTIMAEERRRARKSGHASASIDVTYRAKSRSGSTHTRATTRAATSKKIVLSRVKKRAA